MTLYYLQCDDKSFWYGYWFTDLIYWFIDLIYSLLMYLIVRLYSKFTGLCA
jgi:hypothetical protein